MLEISWGTKMGTIETIAIFIGILLIATRLPALFWPKKTLKWYQSTFASKPVVVQSVAAIAFLLGLAFAYFIMMQVPLLHMFVSFFALLMLIFGFVILLVPELPHFILTTIMKKSDTKIRLLALIAIVVGALMIYLAL